MEAKQLQVEYEEVENLIPYANNANIHSEEQVDQIAASIKKFGFNDPIGVWTNSKGNPEIVEGHGRVLAAKKLGLETVPVIHLDTLTDEQRRAYTHVHNQQTRNSEFDFDLLNMEMYELDFDWQGLGFDVLGIDGLTDEFELDTGTEPQFRTMTLHFDNRTYDFVAGVLDSLELEGNATYSDKVYEVCKLWEKH